MPFTLDSNDPTQVASASKLEIDIGQPNKKMLVFSGIAIPEWDLRDDDSIHRLPATVNLRTTVLAVEQSTVSVGLASIYNGDSDFLFATDSTSLCIDSTSQELILEVDLALLGKPANLSRFGYQVVVIVTTQVTGISGTIRFTKEVFDATVLNTNQEQQLFLVSAGTQTSLPPPSGLSFGQIQYTPLAFGQLGGMTTSGNVIVIPYNIPGAPYNQNLVVQVQRGPSFTPPGQTNISQTAGPNPVLLTTAAPSVSGVDFQIVNVDLR